MSDPCPFPADGHVPASAMSPAGAVWGITSGGAPFICLEPWHGHADYEDFDGDFADREGSEHLAAGEEAMFTYTIEIG